MRLLRNPCLLLRPAARAFACCALLAFPGGALAHPPKPVVEHAYFSEIGGASWYGSDHDGMATADGSSFDRTDFTAAHRSLRMGTVVRVTNLANRRTVKVRIIDRGPHVVGRVIDVSAAAAAELGMQRRGLARVRVRAFRSDQAG